LPDGKTTFLDSPGPGTYQQCETIKKDGKYYISKYKSSGATLINPSKSKRFGN
jgi:hypothetical protein